VEIAAQQAVALVAHLLDTPHDLRIGTPTSTSVRREHQAALDDLRNHLGRAGREQLLEIGVVDGAHDRRQRRRQLVHVVQHAQRRRRVRIRDRDGRRAMDAGREQRLAARRVAEHHRFAGRRRGAHAIGSRSSAT
jgi:hypothetical protein